MTGLQGTLHRQRKIAVGTAFLEQESLFPEDGLIGCQRPGTQLAATGQRKAAAGQGRQRDDKP